MQSHRITMLGTGLIGDFYTMTLHGQCGRVASRWSIHAARNGDEPSPSDGTSPTLRPRWKRQSTIPDTNVVVVGLPNHLHEEAVALAAAAGKAVLCTKPLARTAEGAKRILDSVEKAGVFAGYLEDLCCTPKTLKAIAAVQNGAVGDVTWMRSREAHPGPHSAWFWAGRLTGGGAIIDLGCPRRQTGGLPPRQCRKRR